MGYLANQNNEIIVDAVLTKYGREKLASGQQLGIVKFALSDDEIDYTLYNTNHPMGSDFFDLAIRSMPVLEPVPYSPNQFRYYLFTSQNTTNFVYTMETSYPSQFTEGLYAVGASYTFGASIYPTPSNYNQIWYTAKMPTSWANYVSLEGIIDQSTGVPQDLAQILADLANSDNPGGNIKITTDSVIAYGHSFKLTVNNLPAAGTRLMATVLIDAYNVSVGQKEIQIFLDKALGL